MNRKGIVLDVMILPHDKAVYMASVEKSLFVQLKEVSFNTNVAMKHVFSLSNSRVDADNGTACISGVPKLIFGNEHILYRAAFKPVMKFASNINSVRHVKKSIMGNNRFFPGRDQKASGTVVPTGAVVNEYLRHPGKVFYQAAFCQGGKRFF